MDRLRNVVIEVRIFDGDEVMVVTSVSAMRLVCGGWSSRERDSIMFISRAGIVILKIYYAMKIYATIIICCLLWYLPSSTYCTTSRISTVFSNSLLLSTSPRVIK